MVYFPLIKRNNILRIENAFEFMAARWKLVSNLNRPEPVTHSYHMRAWILYTIKYLCCFIINCTIVRIFIYASGIMTFYHLIELYFYYNFNCSPFDLYIHLTRNIFISWLIVLPIKRNENKFKQPDRHDAYRQMTHATIHWIPNTKTEKLNV